MRTPFGTATPAGAPYLEAIPVFDNPLQRLALFQLQGRSQWSRADQIKLAVFAAPLDDLQFRKVGHGIN
ncbi:MAG TPA: hypothetical protein VJA21_22935 [Verrucomicrobiae bacterium]